MRCVRWVVLGLLAVALAVPSCSSTSATQAKTCRLWDGLKDHLASGEPIVGIEAEIDDIQREADNSGSTELRRLVERLGYQAALMDPHASRPSQGFLNAGRAVEAFCHPVASATT